MTKHQLSPSSFPSKTFWLMVAAVWLGACATGHGAASTLVDYTDRHHAQLTVASNYGQAVNIYLVDGAKRFRLGDVDAYSTRVFRFPQYLNGVPLRVVVECKQSRLLHQTKEFSWQAGERLSLALASILNLSRLRTPLR
jgi:hypothetical protein